MARVKVVTPTQMLEEQRRREAEVARIAEAHPEENQQGLLLLAYEAGMARAAAVQPLRKVVVLELELEKDVPDVATFIAGRAHTIDGVRNADVVCSA